MEIALTLGLSLLAVGVVVIVLSPILVLEYLLLAGWVKRLRDHGTSD